MWRRTEHVVALFDPSPRRPAPTRARQRRPAPDSASLTHRSLPRHFLPSLSAPRSLHSWTLLWTLRRALLESSQPFADWYDPLNRSGMPSSTSYGETSYDQGMAPMRFPQNSGNLPRVPSSSQSSSSSDSLKPPPYPPPSVTPPTITGNVHHLNHGGDTPGTNPKRQRF